ncbi:putative nuclease HARBI1 [Saccostrea echinata]|uniref:putative nuclease HARBI1 n=1 Tax=Saccostrea echinata TaxID=191078 RepID=UPI002A804437|nr:putative nuclease HARBI1 [Saccostrea echinata]
MIGRNLLQSTKNNALPPLLQLLACLRFFATGAYHKLIGDSMHVSESTVGRCCRSVTDAILGIRWHFISFPRDDKARQTKQEFIKIAGFPNALGCVDGTFVRIMTPSNNEQDFVNRKGYHSLNVQMVCDAKFRFTSICANWPGSVHDSRIWRESALCQQFERGEHNGFLLGDSGYPCRRFLMTPYLNPQTDAQQRFNASLCRTRVLIEQSFGILKRRFSCLQGTLSTTLPPRPRGCSSGLVLGISATNNNDSSYFVGIIDVIIIDIVYINIIIIIDIIEFTINHSIQNDVHLSMVHDLFSVKKSAKMSP